MSKPFIEAHIFSTSGHKSDANIPKIAAHGYSFEQQPRIPLLVLLEIQ